MDIELIRISLSQTRAMFILNQQLALIRKLQFLNECEHEDRVQTSIKRNKRR